MITGGDTVLTQLKRKRFLWISGDLGAGKTALAFRLAYSLLATGFVRHLVSNIPSVWTEHPDSIVRNGIRLDTVAIIDEGGAFIKGTEQAEMYTQFARKTNFLIILPSKDPPTIRFQDYAVFRKFDGYTVGLPFWRYGFESKSKGYKDKGTFIWWNPTEIFGVYDTDAMPVDDLGIAEWLHSSIAEIVDEKATETKGYRRFDRRSGKDRPGVIPLGNVPGVEGAEPGGVDTALLEEVVRAADDLTNVSLRESRGR